MTVVLGINGLPGWHIRHDPGAALVVDGQVIAAVEEERLSRIKRAKGLSPVGAAREVLAIAGISPREIDLIAYPWLPAAVDSSDRDVAEIVRNMLQAGGLDTNSPVTFVEHHVAHAWSAIPFIRRSAREFENCKTAALVLDATGETTAGAAFLFDRSYEPKRIWNLAQRASLGAYYEAASRYIGFQEGEEGKTMGLASYGRPENGISPPPVPDIRFSGDLPSRRNHPDLHADSFNVLRTSLIEKFARRTAAPLDFLVRADVARTAEQFVSDRVLKYARELVQEGIEILTFSGGLALNCTINRRIARLCAEYDVEFVVPPAASDTGVALGAALAAANAAQPADAFTGRRYAVDEIVRELEENGLVVASISPAELAAQLIEKSAICGWFDGRSEIGPRALGRRCLVARADSVRIRDHINEIKGREKWRPLAPSMSMKEFRRSCPGEHPSPHMLIAAIVEADSRERLAGVSHVDHSTRAQVVLGEDPYSKLIGEIERATGTAAVTCTSFNKAGEPMVYTPLDAIRSARNMGLDLIAGDGWYARMTK
jgi:carbamoyltransferase